MMAWVWKVAAVIVLWLASVLYANHRGASSEREHQA